MVLSISYIFLCFLIGLGTFPYRGIVDIRDGIIYYPKNDMALLSQPVQEALIYAQDMIGENRRCTIVISSSGTWYYLLKTPACLRYHQPIYGAEISAQKEMVNEAESQKPEWIVMSVPPDDVNPGIPHETLLPILYDWAYKHYEPWFEKNGLTIWRRKKE